MKLGLIIENERRKKGWSRQFLSRQTGHNVSEATIKRVEKAKSYKISANKLIALCAALEIDTGKLKIRDQVK